MKINFLYTKLREYGLMGSLYRMLARVIPNKINYPYYLLMKYVFGHTVITINGVKMDLDLRHDDGLSKELLLNGRRESLTVDYLLSSNTIRNGMTVLDAGGNVGYYALIESRLVGEKGKVYAVEPVFGNFERLKHNVRLNGMQNVHTYQLAMGDKQGEVEIFVRSKKNLSSLTKLPSDAQGGVVRVDRVPMVTVDDFAQKEIGKFPEFVRMDVEGFEASILEGMQKTLAAGAALLIEFHPMYLSDVQKERIVELLKKFNFTRAVVTINPKSELNSILRYLSRKIGSTGEREGLTKEVSMDEFHKLLYSSPRVFNTFLYSR